MLQGTTYAWGPCVLAHLYHDMHQVCYKGAMSISKGVSLLHVWAWERIMITWPEGVGERDANDPFLYIYYYFLTYR